MAMKNQIRAMTSVVALLAGLGAGVPAQAGMDMEALLEIMKAKGVLSEEEYQQFRQEAREARREEAAAKAQAKADKEDLKKTMVGKAPEKDGQWDGLKWGTADGRNEIALTGRAQLDARFHDGWGGLNSEGKGADGSNFDLRRARLGVEGKFLGDYKFKVEADMTQAAAKLEEGYVTYAPVNWFNLTAGKTKLPIGIDQIGSSRFLDFMERNVVNNSLVDNAAVLDKDNKVEKGAPGFGPAAKQPTIMIGGEPLKGLTYAVAVSKELQGENTPSGQTPNDVATTARITTNLAEFFGLQDTVIHLGTAFDHRAITGSNSVSLGRTEGRDVSGAVAVDLTGVCTNKKNCDKDTYTLEGSLAYKWAKLTGEWAVADVESDTNKGTKSVDAYSVTAMVNLTGESFATTYKAANQGYAWGGGLKPNRPFSLSGGGFGAWQLGVRYSKLDASDFVGAATTAPKLLATESEAWTYGLTWIPTNNTRVYFNYVDTKFSGKNLDPALKDDRVFMTRFGFFF